MSQPAVTASSAGQSRAGLNGTVVIFALLLATAVMPILWPSLPAAMVDYNNHLARMFVLARDGTAQAHPYYQVSWSLVPNLAMDLIVPGIGRHIGVETANRLFYLLDLPARSGCKIVHGWCGLSRTRRSSCYFLPRTCLRWEFTASLSAYMSSGGPGRGERPCMKRLPAFPLLRFRPCCSPP
ncbi:MAG: hypothetical protein WBM12_03365 [Pseudolabrys sp.]